MRLGNGNGTFRARISNDGYGLLTSVALADLNGDGKLDAAATDINSALIQIALGNGNGTFQALTGYSIGADPTAVSLQDLHGDGKYDVVTADFNSNGISVRLGNGNGTFKARVSYSSGDAPLDVTLADFNGDGAADITSVASGHDRVDVFLADVITSSTVGRIDLTTQAGALSAMSIIDSALEAVQNELASIGSFQSRIATAVCNLLQTRANYDAAESRIMDADAAEETAELVKGKILEQASSAILA